MRIAKIQLDRLNALAKSVSEAMDSNAKTSTSDQRELTTAMLSPDSSTLSEATTAPVQLVTRVTELSALILMNALLHLVLQMPLVTTLKDRSSATATLATLATDLIATTSMSVLRQTSEGIIATTTRNASTAGEVTPAAA